MNWGKNLYVFMLGAIIVFSGCFGTGTTDGADDTDDTESNGNNSGESSGVLLPDNLPPVISVSWVDLEFYEGGDCTTAGISVSARHAMTDWDGAIQQAGWDIDLDGTIDYLVTADEGYTTLEMPMSAMIWYNNSWDDGDEFRAYLENSIAFGAQDDDGEWTSSQIIKLQKIAMSNSIYSDISYYLDFEPCRDFSNAADYNFSFADNSDIISSGSNDILVDITRTNGQAGISWDHIRIFFDGNYEGDMGCSITTSWPDMCLIIQSGSDDTLWEPGEMITLKEDNRNIHSGNGGSAEIMIQLLQENSQNTWGTMEVEDISVV
jgi:hypothetical protein